MTDDEDTDVDTPADVHPVHRLRRPPFATDEDWHTAMVEEFSRKMITFRPFSSEDLRRVVGMPPHGHPNAFGSVFGWLVKSNRDRLRIAGLKRSDIPSARGRWLPVYQRRALR